MTMDAGDNSCDDYLRDVSENDAGVWEWALNSEYISLKSL